MPEPLCQAIPNTDPAPSSKLPQPMRDIRFTAIQSPFGDEDFWILALAAHGDLVDDKPYTSREVVPLELHVRGQDVVGGQGKNGPPSYVRNLLHVIDARQSQRLRTMNDCTHPVHFLPGFLEFVRMA